MLSPDKVTKIAVMLLSRLNKKGIEYIYIPEPDGSRFGKVTSKNGERIIDFRGDRMELDIKVNSDDSNKKKQLSADTCLLDIDDGVLPILLNFLTNPNYINMAMRLFMTDFFGMTTADQFIIDRSLLTYTIRNTKNQRSLVVKSTGEECDIVGIDKNSIKHDLDLGKRVNRAYEITVALKAIQWLEEDISEEKE